MWDKNPEVKLMKSNFRSWSLHLKEETRIKEVDIELNSREIIPSLHEARRTGSNLDILDSPKQIFSYLNSFIVSSALRLWQSRVWWSVFRKREPNHAVTFLIGFDWYQAGSAIFGQNERVLVVSSPSLGFTPYRLHPQHYITSYTTNDGSMLASPGEKVGVFGRTYAINSTLNSPEYIQLLTVAEVPQRYETRNSEHARNS